MFRTADPKVELLRDLSLFAGLSRRDIRRVAALGDVVEAPAGRALTTQGEFGLEFFVIVGGTATVTHDGVDVAQLGPGDFFGELALVDRTRRTATVTANTPMRLLVIHTSAFASLLSNHPQVGARVLAVMGPRLRELDGLHAA